MPPSTPNPWTYPDGTSCLATVYNNNGDPVGKAATLSCLPLVFANLINWALIFAGSVAVIMIMWSGIRFIRSGGDAKQAQGARQTMTWAIIGLIIILLSFAIINFISDFTGVHCIKTFGLNTCGTGISLSAGQQCDPTASPDACAPLTCKAVTGGGVSGTFACQ